MQFAHGYARVASSQLISHPSLEELISNVLGDQHNSRSSLRTSASEGDRSHLAVSREGLAELCALYNKEVRDYERSSLISNRYSLPESQPGWYLEPLGSSYQNGVKKDYRKAPSPVLIVLENKENLPRYSQVSPYRTIDSAQPADKVSVQLKKSKPINSDKWEISVKVEETGRTYNLVFPKNQERLKLHDCIEQELVKRRLARYYDILIPHTLFSWITRKRILNLPPGYTSIPASTDSTVIPSLTIENEHGRVTWNRLMDVRDFDFSHAITIGTNFIELNDPKSARQKKRSILSGRCMVVYKHYPKVIELTQKGFTTERIIQVLESVLSQNENNLAFQYKPENGTVAVETNLEDASQTV